jgi:hypothetical protein
LINSTCSLQSSGFRITRKFVVDPSSGSQSSFGLTAVVIVVDCDVVAVDVSDDETVDVPVVVAVVFTHS